MQVLSPMLTEEAQRQRGMGKKEKKMRKNTLKDNRQLANQARMA